MTGRIKAILSAFALYLSLSGLVTFSLFLLEESIQTAMFGTWPAQDAKDWITAKSGLSAITAATKALNTMNNALGWVQPLAWVAYHAYGRSSQVYIDGLQAKIFANAPELFDGETISVTFTPQAVTFSDGSYQCTNRAITVLSKSPCAPSVSFRMTGRVSVASGVTRITEISPDAEPNPIFPPYIPD